MFSGRYFVDNNDNDREDGSDPGVSGATVTLFQGSTAVASTTTASNGTYSFTGLANGFYSAHFEAQSSAFVRGNVGGNDAIDSDVWTTQNGVGVTGAFQITNTLNQTNVDAGVEAGGAPPPPPPPPPPAGDGGSLSGRYFIDNNGNNLEDGGDGNVSGATVTLFQGSSAVTSTTTASNGTYSFNNLADGFYSVRFTGSDFVRGNVGGNDAIDSDVWTTQNGAGVTGAFQVTSSQSVTNVDAGVEAGSAPPPPPPPPPGGDGG